MTTKETTGTEEQKFDLRILQQRMRRGEIEPREYDAYLKKLPDDESRGEYIEVFEEKQADEATPNAGPLAFTQA